MKQQRIARNEKPKTVIQNLKAPNVPPSPQLSPETIEIANQPVRTVLYVECNDMEAIRVQLLVSEISKAYNPNRFGVHYILPVRHGKIGPDIMFEQEFLNVVKDICEIKDGEIVLKDGAKEVKVVRQSV